MYVFFCRQIALFLCLLNCWGFNMEWTTDSSLEHLKTYFWLNSPSLISRLCVWTVIMTDAQQALVNKWNLVSWACYSDNTRIFIKLLIERRKAIFQLCFSSQQCHWMMNVTECLELGTETTAPSYWAPENIANFTKSPARSHVIPNIYLSDKKHFSQARFSHSTSHVDGILLWLCVWVCVCVCLCVCAYMCVRLHVWFVCVFVCVCTSSLNATPFLNPLSNEAHSS